METHRGKAVIALGLALALAACVRQEAPPATSLESFSEGRFGFRSYTRLYWDELLPARFDGLEEVVIDAEIQLPDSKAGPLPAVIIMHGSGGAGARQQRYADALNEIGIATAVLDSFGPRGIRTTGGRQEQVSSSTMIGDVYALLNLLASHPQIDDKRIGLMGTSKGGAVTVLSADEQVRRALARDGARFAAHAALYPACVIQFQRPQTSGAPVLMMLGALDSYTPAVQCEAQAEKMRAAAFPVREIVYPDAHHAWDATYEVRKSDFDFSYGGCQLEIDPQGRGIDPKTGEVLDPRDLAAARRWIRACATPGVWIGRNQAAKDQSLADLKTFFRETLLE